MDLQYYMKLQNAYGTKNRREKELIKVNYNASKHFNDTFDTDTVLVNNVPIDLMIIKDTDGNTFKKKIKSRHEDKFNLGDYVVWNNQVWLVTLLDPDDKVWNRGYMYLCTILLRYQNENGDIVERWGYAEDYTKYSSGETGNSTITIGDYQYGITLPSDFETRKLRRGIRFVIDYQGNYPPDVYELTSKKAYLNDNNYFDRGGVITFSLSYNFFNEEKDKLITLEDGTQVWICDYHSPTPQPTPQPSINIIATITGGNTLRCGRTKSWSVSFKDSAGVEVADCDFKWNVVSEFAIKQTIDTANKKIQLRVDDEAEISSSFLLQIIMSVDGVETIVAENKITVVQGL